MKKSFFIKIVSFFIGLNLSYLNAQTQIQDRCFMPENAVELRGYSGFHEQSKIWASQIIPYYFDKKLPDNHKSSFLQSIDILESSNNLCFIPRRNEVQSIGVFSFDKDYSYADLKENTIYLQAPSTYLVIHELCHLFGMSHEHQRPQRGDFIKIHYENIDPNFISAFTLYSNFYAIGTPSYDYFSIMHYNSLAFSTNGLPTIERIDGGAMGGNILSSLDISLLDSLYPKSIDCQKAREERAPFTFFELKNTKQICTYESVALENKTEFADAYHWQIDSGATLVGDERAFNTYFTTAGRHTITQKSTNIFDTSEYTITVNVQDCQGFEIAQFSPNPTQGNLQCKFSKVIPPEVKLSILANNGQIMHTKVFTRDFEGQNELSIDVPQTLSDGSYFVQIEMYGFTAIKSFVLVR
jgi:hypothetical protein